MLGSPHLTEATMTKRTLGAALALIPLLTACGPGDREAGTPAAAGPT